MPIIPQNDKKDLLCEAFSSFMSLPLIMCEQGREVIFWHAHTVFLHADPSQWDVFVFQN